MSVTKTSGERKIPVNTTLQPQNVAFLDEQIAAGRFANRSVAIDFAIFLFAKSEAEKKASQEETIDYLMKWIGRLQEETELLNQKLENAVGDAMEEWQCGNVLGSKALELAHRVETLEAEIAELKAAKAEPAKV